jgi:membrane protease YdiL (CAAX protease family)
MEHSIDKHTLFKSIVLHLLPGILVGAGYYLLVPVAVKFGFPSAMALLATGVLILIPFEFGFLLYQKMKTREKLFNGLIRYLKPIPLWQYFVFVLLIILLTGLLFKAFEFSSELLHDLFRWIPPGMEFSMGFDGEYSHQKLLVTYILFLILIVIIVPVLEEFYFRGYLLPRMPDKLKSWTGLVHSGLFALYHTWTPWMFFVRTVGLLPLVYVVRRKENIILGIIAHCLLNSMDFIIAMNFLMKLKNSGL